MSDDNFYSAIALHEAEYKAARRAERLNAAQVEVQRRQAEVDDRRAQLDDASLEPLARSRLETGLSVSTQRLAWAQAALQTTETGDTGS